MIGKNLWFFAGMITISCLMCVTGVAGATASVSILPSVETVAPGEEFTLDVYVKPDTQIAGIQLDINTDCPLVTIEYVEEGELFSSTGSPVMFNPGTIEDNGKKVSQVYGSLIMEDGTSDEGTFCTIKLVASEDTGNCQLRVENIIVGDTQGNELDTVTYDALVSISGEIETTDIDSDNDDDTELIVRQDETADSSDDEEETALQSAQDTVESNDPLESAPAPNAENSTSNINILAVSAIAFLALAYVLDRKKK